MKLVNTYPDSALYRTQNGLGDVYMLFADTMEKLLHVTRDLITESPSGRRIQLAANDTAEILTAKWNGWEYSPITYCYCGNVKQLSGLNCTECSSWSKASR